MDIFFTSYNRNRIVDESSGSSKKNFYKACQFGKRIIFDAVNSNEQGKLKD